MINLKKPIMKTGFFILIPLILILSCVENSGQPGQRLDVVTFEKKLAEMPDRILIDVRTEPEYRQGHLPEAVLIDIKQSNFTDEVSKLNKSKPVFVYCGSGIRSEKAVKILNELDFQEVYELESGFGEWAKAGKPFVKD